VDFLVDHGLRSMMTVTLERSSATWSIRTWGNRPCYRSQASMCGHPRFRDRRNVAPPSQRMQEGEGTTEGIVRKLGGHDGSCAVRSVHSPLLSTAPTMTMSAPMMRHMLMQKHIGQIIIAEDIDHHMDQCTYYLFSFVSSLRKSMKL
jgi:hypothetical protein